MDQDISRPGVVSEREASDLFIDIEAVALDNILYKTCSERFDSQGATNLRRAIMIKGQPRPMARSVAMARYF